MYPCTYVIQFFEFHSGRRFADSEEYKRIKYLIPASTSPEKSVTAI